jgi:hypothetical protein
MANSDSKTISTSQVLSVLVGLLITILMAWSGKQELAIDKLQDRAVTNQLSIRDNSKDIEAMACDIAEIKGDVKEVLKSMQSDQSYYHGPLRDRIKGSEK